MLVVVGTSRTPCTTAEARGVVGVAVAVAAVTSRRLRLSSIRGNTV